MRRVPRDFYVAASYYVTRISTVAHFLRRPVEERYLRGGALGSRSGVASVPMAHCGSGAGARSAGAGAAAAAVDREGECANRSRLYRWVWAVEASVDLSPSAHRTQ